jgi:SpoVK/Ycf46/Vps4 family AAA+-type ATPase
MMCYSRSTRSWLGSSTHEPSSRSRGETEKNLDRLFDRAAQEDWILFFDEADALFGRRTEITSSHDRYANQEVSYLLQRMEDFPGLVILSANFKGNLDEAFVRRFQSVVSFPLPDAQQRLRLWENILVADGRVANDVDLEEIAQSYELSGGAITNAVRYGAVSALQQDRDRMGHDDLVEGIRNELRREGRTL